MGLITKEVEMKWCNNNAKNYIKKGYEFTRYGDTFLVDVKDLAPYTNKVVNVICDNCLTKISMKMAGYTINKKEDKYYCRRCSQRMFGGKKMQNTKLVNSISFEKWCKDNNKLSILCLWDYKLNAKTPDRVSYGSKDKYYFKCPNGLHESFLKCIYSITHNNFQIDSACDPCNSFGFWCEKNNHIDYLQLWDYELNKHSPYDVGHGSHKKYYFKCSKGLHKSESIMIKHIVSGNTKLSCSKCKSFYEWCINNNRCDILDLWDYELNNCNPDEISYGVADKFYFKCGQGTHQSYLTKINNITSFDFHCPDCSRERTESFLQEKVRTYISQKYNYKINHEFECTILPINPKTDKILPFDNEVNELKLIIEVNGIQHYYQSPWHEMLSKNSGKTPEKEFKYQKIKDRYKRIIAKLNGFSYLEIPYWTEKDESYKQLIDEKINSLLR